MTRAAESSDGASRGDSFESFEALCWDAMRSALQDVARSREQAVRLVASAGEDPDRVVLSRVALSHAMCYAGEFAQAYQTLAEAEAHAQAAARRLTALHANAMVQPLVRLGRLDDALAAGRHAVATAREVGDDAGVAKALVGLGATQRAAGRLEQAIESLTEAGARAPEEAVMAAAESNLGECLLDLDRFSEALASFERAADAFVRAGRPHAAAIVRGNRADLLGRLGRLDDAAVAFESARRSFEATGAATDAARLSCEEAEMLAAAGALRAARDRYQSALTALESAGAAGDLARARVALAGVLLDLGDHRGARRVLADAESSSDAAPLLRGSWWLATARCERAAGRLDQAAAALDRAVTDFADRPARLARCELERAELLREQRLWDAALAAIERAERQALASPLGPICAAARSRCLDDRGDRSKALDALSAACERADRELAVVASTSGRAGLAHRYAPMFALLASWLLDAEAREAKDAIVRAAEVASSISRTRPIRDESGLAGRLALVTQSITRRTLEAGLFPDRAASSELAALSAEAESIADRLGGAAAVAPSALGIDAVSKAASAMTGSVVAHWFDDGPALSLLVLAGDEHRIVRHVANPGDLAAACRRLAFIAERAAQSDTLVDAGWSGAADRLATMLLDPIAHAIGAPLSSCECLFVHGPDALGHVPWSALGLLRQCCPIAVLPSLGMLTRERATRGGARTVLLAAQHESLPHAILEAQRCAAAWSNADIFVDGSAEDHLAATRGAGVLHVATHGVFVPERPRLARLWIGDRWVTVGELADNIAPAAVVLLSACHAARRGGLAEDRQSIPGLLLEAGASAVIAPIWPLGDRTASALFPMIHTVLARSEGVTMDARLRKAIASAARADLGLDAAGLVLHGGLPC